MAGTAFGLETTSRVKCFVFSFVSVPFKWASYGAGKMRTNSTLPLLQCKRALIVERPLNIMFYDKKPSGAPHSNEKKLI